MFFYSIAVREVQTQNSRGSGTRERRGQLVHKDCQSDTENKISDRPGFV